MGLLRLGRVCLCLLVAGLAPFAAVHGAEDVAPQWRFIHNAPETEGDQRYAYHWRVLRAALEITRGKYGDYRLEPGLPMSEKLQVVEMQRPRGTLNTMVLDATQQHAQPLTAERLFGWHAALFPTGFSGRVRIQVGAWRNDAAGPMQVVSGPVGREKVHFEAPPADTLPAQTAAFLAWFNAGPLGDALVHAGLAHLWLVTLHPFDDGNGRISRAVGDMALARAEGSAQRFYSLSAQIQRERKQYYEQLEATQRGTMDVTPWLEWFFACLLRAVQGADGLLAGVLDKAQFWQRWSGTPLNARQISVLNRVLDGMDGQLTNAKWATLGQCSADTALRDINDLLARGVLRRLEGGGRNTAYGLVRSKDPR